MMPARRTAEARDAAPSLRSLFNQSQKHDYRSSWRLFRRIFQPATAESLAGRLGTERRDMEGQQRGIDYRASCINNGPVLSFSAGGFSFPIPLLELCSGSLAARDQDNLSHAAKMDWYWESSR